jgi:hypothetical protein
MAEPESNADGREYSVQQDDAVCFSAGLTGAPFGAGTTHAYLASDRKPPIVAAGISLGALNAAVMERCYRDMELCLERSRPRTEAARWGWYRRYLTFLLNRPFDVVSDAVPDPSDLIADLPPVEEPNLPVDENGATVSLARQLEIQSRRKLYIVAKLGSWLAHLPIRVSSIAWLTVRYVRARENYPRNILQVWNLLCLQGNLLWTLWRLLWHTAAAVLGIRAMVPVREEADPRAPAVAAAAGMGTVADGGGPVVHGALVHAEEQSVGLGRNH